MTIKLIIGLSNPGQKYVTTRHNAGAWYIYLLAKQLHVTLYEDPRFFGYISYVDLSGKGVYLLVPNIFMNLNGKSVAAISTFYNINSNEILVAHDELDLPPGVAKFKLNGGHGGHNGLKDIIKKLGNSSNFYHLRIGIGHPRDKNKVSNFVLNEPLISEQKLIDDAINEAVCCTKIWFSDNLIKATNRLNSFKAK